MLRKLIGDRSGRVTAMLARDGADCPDNLNESEQVVNLDQFIGAAPVLLQPPGSPQWCVLDHTKPYEDTNGACASQWPRVPMTHGDVTVEAFRHPRLWVFANDTSCGSALSDLTHRGPTLGRGCGECRTQRLRRPTLGRRRRDPRPRRETV